MGKFSVAESDPSSRGGVRVRLAASGSEQAEQLAQAAAESCEVSSNEHLAVSSSWTLDVEPPTHKRRRGRVLPGSSWAGLWEVPKIQILKGLHRGGGCLEG